MTSKTRVERAAAKPTGPRAERASAVLVARPDLRTVVGNQAAQRLLAAGRLQAKRQVSAPGDPLEQEADRMAERVMRKAGPRPDDEENRCKSGGSCGRGIVQRQATGSGCPATAPVVHALNTGLGAGRPLEPATRAFFEPRFGHDFSQVRIHTDAGASASAQSIHALAYTLGRDVVFGSGNYRPDTERGRDLLAHELAHVVQQQADQFPAIARRAAIGELPPLSEVNFDAIADQLFEAMDQAGTDEEAVYSGLRQLQGNQVAIDFLIQRYAARHHNSNLIADIRDEFEDEELEYALQLLNRGRAGSKQEIGRTPQAAMDLDRAAQRLFEAMDPIGTDEEAVYATLVVFNRATRPLEERYRAKYGRALRADIIDEMSGSELDHAIGLLAFDADYFVEHYFETDERPMALKIVADLQAVTDRMDFHDDEEFATEVRKRLRTSQLMQESQTSDAFAYPESCTQDAAPGQCIGHGQPGDADYVPPDINFNARVNKEAKDYWVKSRQPGLYYFELSADGRKNPYGALVTLFEPQKAIVDKTLIHCDYLTTVVHMRAFAEAIGKKEFNRRVQGGQIQLYLSYNGFQGIMAGVWQPTAVSLQEVRPSSENDLVIGDHVVFWNHPAYDALTSAPKWRGPWRLENALLVDKNSSGENLFEGHGAVYRDNVVRPGTRVEMLEDMAGAYNGVANHALMIAARVDNNIPGSHAERAEQFPNIAREGAGNWKIKEPAGLQRVWQLRELSGANDPELTGLRDPADPGKMGMVKRPIESAPGRSPSRPK